MSPPMRRSLLLVMLALALITCQRSSSSVFTTPVATGTNVLLIIVDDLRPDVVGAAGGAAITPHLDRLAMRGMWFDRAYSQQAVCRPSRASFLTGLRPDSTGVHDLDTPFRQVRPWVTTLPQLFRERGYRTLGIGKVFHYDAGEPEPGSWSEPLVPVEGEDWASPENLDLIRMKRRGNERPLGPPTERSFVSPASYPDAKIAAEAEAALDRFSRSEQAFFLAVGFTKPHLPFAAPAEYWDRYDRREVGDPDPAEPPLDVPEPALINFPELRGYHGMPGSKLDEPWKSKEPLTKVQAARLRHGYLAAVSFVDEQIGRVLARLEALGLDDDTIVVVLSDHGFKLGEYGAWAKHTNFEVDLRSLLIVSAPEEPRRGPPVLEEESITGPPRRWGQSCRALVELVDVFPTVCELAGLRPLAGLEGHSLVPLLEDPKRAWKSAAFSQFPREARGLMGRSIRTEEYRLTAWLSRDESERLFAVELYDHRDDDREAVNVAEWPEYASVREDLLQRLKAGWRAAAPPSSD